MRHVLPICNNILLKYTVPWKEGFLLFGYYHECFSERSKAVSKPLIARFILVMAITFTQDAIKSIFEFSGGNLRLINQACS